LLIAVLSFVEIADVCFSISVATAATASSLLALPAGNDPPASPSSETAPQPQSGPRAALLALRRRLHNSNANTAPAPTEDNGLESVLRSYMQRAMNRDTAPASDARQTDGPAAPVESGNDPNLATILPNADESSFEEFLNNMQYSLIQSLREFNNDPTLLPVQQVATRTGNLHQGTGTRAEQSASETVAPTQSNALSDTTSDPVPSPMHVEEDHTQASTGTEPRDPVDGDTEESPSRLSFFRMYQFPARNQPPPENAPTSGDEAPPTSLIPAVIVGVRSINRDISAMNGETVAQVPFPFRDGADMQDHAMNSTAPPEAAEANGASTEPSGDPATQPPLTDTTSPDVDVPPEHRNRIVRALAALVQRDEQRARQQSEAARRAAAFVTNNYVIWVVGGNYPAGHPILTIPHLFTGELNHDDLWALAEAMGQHKPPVATKDDIAKAGLRVIKGSEIATAVERGQVHDMCLDRCLVSTKSP
jgi:hypothetical protein